jgi:hypothetical protein
VNVVAAQRAGDRPTIDNVRRAARQPDAKGPRRIRIERHPEGQLRVVGQTDHARLQRLGSEKRQGVALRDVLEQRLFSPRRTSRSSSIKPWFIRLPHQRGAAHDVHALSRLLLQSPDLVDVSNDAGVLPSDSLQGPGQDNMGRSLREAGIRDLALRRTLACRRRVSSPHALANVHSSGPASLRGATRGLTAGAPEQTLLPEPAFERPDRAGARPSVSRSPVAHQQSW